MLPHFDLDIQVTRWPIVNASLALPSKTNLITVIDPRRDFDR